MENTDFLIFLADDDQDDRQFLIDAFAELPQKISLKTFDNGVELMASLLKRGEMRPDMIFLDLNMPLMNGEECLNDIRQEPVLAQIPVVIYSNMLDLDKAAMLHNKGANLYLQKPPSFDVLKNALKHCLRYADEDSIYRNDRTNFIIKY